MTSTSGYSTDESMQMDSESAPESSLETSYEASTSISSPSKFDYRLDEIRKMQKTDTSEQRQDVPFPIREPALYDAKELTSLKQMEELSQEVHTDEFTESFDYNLSSPDECSHIDKLSYEEQINYYKKLAAHQLRERMLKLSQEKKLSRSQKYKYRQEKYKETFQAEFELCQQEVQRYLQEISARRGLELAELYKMLDSSDIDYFEASEALKEQISDFYKQLAQASPINDHFIENIGRLTFKYKEVEKRDFGLSIEDLITLDDKLYDRLVLELPEYEGLGDVDIQLYRYLYYDGIIYGIRHYTSQQEEEQRPKLAAARVYVRAKYPWMFKGRHSTAAPKKSTSEQIRDLKAQKRDKRRRQADSRREQFSKRGK